MPFYPPPKKKPHTGMGVAEKWPNKASEKNPLEGNQSPKPLLVRTSKPRHWWQTALQLCLKGKQGQDLLLNASTTLMNTSAAVLQLNLLTSNHKNLHFH